MPRSAHFDHGYVVGLLVSDRLDSPADADRLPDVVGATNVKPKFTRQQGQHRHPLREPEHGAHGMLVNPQPITAAVLADGHITGDVDASGRPLPDAQPGIWLVAGVHRVELGSHFPSFTVEVTTDHTETNPLDLYAASPYVPPTGATVQTVLLPANGLPGQVLSRTEDGSLAWVEQTGGGTPVQTTPAVGTYFLSPWVTETIDKPVSVLAYTYSFLPVPVPLTIDTVSVWVHTGQAGAVGEVKVFAANADLTVGALLTTLSGADFATTGRRDFSWTHAITGPGLFFQVTPTNISVRLMTGRFVGPGAGIGNGSPSQTFPANPGQYPSVITTATSPSARVYGVLVMLRRSA